MYVQDQLRLFWGPVNIALTARRQQCLASWALSLLLPFEKCFPSNHSVEAFQAGVPEMGTLKSLFQLQLVITGFWHTRGLIGQNPTTFDPII